MDNNNLDDIKKIKDKIISISKKHRDEYPDQAPLDVVKRLNDLEKLNLKINPNSNKNLNKKVIKDLDKLRGEELLAMVGEDAILADSDARYKLYDIYRDVCLYFPKLTNAFKLTAEHVVSSEGLSKGNTYNVAPADTDGKLILDDKLVEENYLKKFRTSFSLQKMAYKKSVGISKDGDYFVEIIDVENFISKGLDKFITEEEVVDKTFKENFLKEHIQINGIEDNLDALIEAKKENIGKSSTEYDFERVIVRRLQPERVVKLEIDETVFGYIVLDFEDIKERNGATSSTTVTEPGVSNNDSSEISDIANQYANDRYGKNKAEVEGSVRLNLEKELKTLVMASLSKDENVTKESVKKAINSNKELAKFITFVLHNSESFKTRFVKSENIIHYKKEPVIFDDSVYGESDLLGLLSDIRDYIKMKKTLSKHLILNSIERQKIIVDVDTNSDVEGAVNSVISTFKEKEKALLASLNSTELVGSTISPFDRFYVPRINGETPIDFETIAPPSSNLSKDDLKMWSDDIVNGIRTPSSLLDSSNATYHTAMTQESMSYAVTILDMQRLITTNDYKVANRVHEILKGKELPGAFTYKLNPPTALLLEGLETKVSSLSSIVDFIRSLYVDENSETKTTELKRISIAKYLSPDMEWDKYDEMYRDDTNDFIESQKEKKSLTDEGGEI